MARDQLPDPVHEIDLHGLSVKQALSRLRRDLALCATRRRSPVLVITGRGWGSAEGKSVLAPAVKRWLHGPEARALGVRESKPLHRGGALWVRLVAPEG